MRALRLSSGAEVDPKVASTVRKLLGKSCTPRDVRAMVDGDAAETPRLWSVLTAGGWTGIEYPTELGGDGGTLAEATTTAIELGAALSDEQFLACAYLGGPLLVNALSTADDTRWLHPIVEGSKRAVVVGGLSARTRPDVEVSDHGHGWVMDGVAGHVLGATAEHYLLVRARRGEDDVYVVVSGDEPGIYLEREPAVDRTRRVSHCVFHDAAVAPLAVIAGTAAAQLTRQLQTRAALGLAADSVGGSRRVLELTVEYARQREQFGRPIGSFQAVKHHCADMLVGVRMATALLWESLDGSDRDLHSAAQMAYATATRTFVAIAGTAIQVHGGIGFSWDHDLHLFLKRAVLNEMLMGGPDVGPAAIGDSISAA